jgi:prepilin-type N-terminal cleavage/methylation domain-containing protein
MNLRPSHFQRSAFTMVEVAISLAIIGIALVAIVGVLPRGMDVQRDNREATIINQDATIFIEAIRNGSRGLDDLTNYVYAIVNVGSNPVGYINPWLTNAMNFSGVSTFPSVTQWYPILTNGASIVGLSSTPEFVNGGSNHIYVCVRSISGPAVEKPPQDNPIIQQDSFGYRIVSENMPVQTADTTAYGQALTGNLYELRLTFLWPVLPNGQLPSRPARQTYRALIAGQNIQDPNNPGFYFFQPQTFTAAP